MYITAPGEPRLSRLHDEGMLSIPISSVQLRTPLFYPCPGQCQVPGFLPTCSPTAAPCTPRWMEGKDTPPPPSPAPAPGRGEPTEHPLTLPTGRCRNAAGRQRRDVFIGHCCPPGCSLRAKEGLKEAEGFPSWGLVWFWLFQSKIGAESGCF